MATQIKSPPSSPPPIPLTPPKPVPDNSTDRTQSKHVTVSIPRNICSSGLRKVFLRVVRHDPSIEITNSSNIHLPRAKRFCYPPKIGTLIPRSYLVEMLLSLDTIPRLQNILASFFTWILLAGFLVFPGTFTSLDSLGNDTNINQAAMEILRTVKHVQLLVVAGICSGVGCVGMVWLWIRYRQNYVWLLNKIFLPGSLNSFAGLISTLINVYSQQGGLWVRRRSVKWSEES